MADPFLHNKALWAIFISYNSATDNVKSSLSIKNTIEKAFFTKHKEN